MTHIAELRENYTKGTLNINDVSLEPIAQFQRWFNEAVETQLPEPNAMHLATVGADDKPVGRIVLLKGVDSKGFTFFTNYQSRKGSDLAVHPYAAITFFWVELERQVRIEGMIEKVSDQESDAYFAVRPRSSQIGAWVSAQSTVIESRELLEERTQHYEVEFAGKPVPRPAHWGGYCLAPYYVEFWQGRPSRLHDRIAYTKLDTDDWKIERLSP